MASFFERVALSRYAGALAGLIIVSIYLAWNQPVFLSWANLMNIVKSNSVVFILALGATYVVISAGVDLSVASATAACAMIFGLLVRADLGILSAIVLTCGFGIFLGAINGVLISWFKISFFVVTLGTLSIFQSFALIVTDGNTLSLFTKPAFMPLNAFVNGQIGPIPNLLFVDLALLLLAGGVLRYTSFGRAIFAIGSNAEAARLSGINIRRELVFVYAVAGLAVGIASVVQVGRLTAASPDVDPTLLLTVLAAVLIGGTAFSGGEGGVFGTMIGVLFLGVLQNGLTLSEVSSFWQGMVSGLILICAVWLGGARNFLRRRRQMRQVESEPQLRDPSAMLGGAQHNHDNTGGV